MFDHYTCRLECIELLVLSPYCFVINLCDDVFLQMNSPHFHRMDNYALLTMIDCIRHICGFSMHGTTCCNMILVFISIASTSLIIQIRKCYMSHAHQFATGCLHVRILSTPLTHAVQAVFKKPLGKCDVTDYKFGRDFRRLQQHRFVFGTSIVAQD